MALTARISSNRTKLLPRDLQVPVYARRTINHKIYWRQKSNKSAIPYNTLAECYTRPCLRRWLEFTDGIAHPELPYLLCYEPPNILQRPERIWVLYDGTEPVATFTNMVEGWLIVLGMKEFGGQHGYTLHYIDRT